MATESFTERRVRTIVEEQPPGALKLTLTYLLNEIARLKERIADLEVRAKSSTGHPAATDAVPPPAKPMAPTMHAGAGAGGMWMPPA